MQNRRELVVLGVGLLAGCAASGNSAARRAGVVDAGPATDYAADGVYDRFRKDGFFLVRTRGALVAISSICTHRECLLNAAADHSFHCKCHGSIFDPTGKLTRGPARRDLPRLPTSIDETGRLLVHVDAS